MPKTSEPKLAKEPPKAKPATPAKAPRNLVVCCDGTSNEIGTKLSNVLKLYRILEKSDQQITYYHPGIGTVAMPNSWGKWRQKIRAGFEMATGKGLDRDVLNAYCFLCKHYQEGDRIYMFGFSRGAYTARIVAGMIQLIGLMREHQTNFAGYALKAYKASSSKNNFETAKSFNRTVNGSFVPIHFMGLWDTVASVIVPGRIPFLSSVKLEDLPLATKNPAVKTFRHALAIDEFRRLFRPVPWDAGQKFKPNPYSVEKTTVDQDSREVWFAGCHSDIGGGFVENESALSKFALLWMLEQANMQGLKTRTSMINHIVRGHVRANARVYTKPDAAGLLHKSLAHIWWLAEIFPKRARLRDWLKRRKFLGFYIPRGEPRTIKEDSFVHQSVLTRKDKITKYRPVNLPASFRTEP